LVLEELPTSLTTIGAYAFKDCKSLKSVTIPMRVTTIGTGAFRGCDAEIANKPDAGDGK
jgi:hypothetical protein